MIAKEARPIIDWVAAPEWAQFHIFQSWGEGEWCEAEPQLGEFFHNRGRWYWAPGVIKYQKSGYQLPVGYDYRETLERRPEPKPQRTIVCLCGSTRFSEAYQQANLEETLAGKIVLTIGCDMRSDAEIFQTMSQEELLATKEALDELHLDKIALAHEVLILNVDGYIGHSTARELEHARSLGKKIRFWEDERIKVTM